MILFIRILRDSLIRFKIYVLKEDWTIEDKVGYGNRVFRLPGGKKVRDPVFFVFNW